MRLILLSEAQSSMVVQLHCGKDNVPKLFIVFKLRLTLFFPLDFIGISNELAVMGKCTCPAKAFSVPT